MAYTLNTSHALYANLVELIGVKDGALVSHKTARTFTKHADATYGTGTYGEHFAAHLKEKGVLVNPPEGGLCRFVTHYWISAEAVETAAAIIEDYLKGATA